MATRKEMYCFLFKARDGHWYWRGLDDAIYLTDDSRDAYHQLDTNGDLQVTSAGFLIPLLPGGVTPGSVHEVLALVTTFKMQVRIGSTIFVPMVPAAVKAG